MNRHHTFISRLSFVLLLGTILLSACAPLQPMTPAAPAAAGDADRASSLAHSSTRRDLSGAAAPAAEAMEAPAAEMPATPREEMSSSYAAPTRPYQGRTEPVTAGVVDDNEQWADYLDYRSRHRWVYANDRDVSERYVIHVWDEAARPVHDAMVTVYQGDVELFRGRTDAGGQVLFFPRALATQGWSQSQAREVRVVAEKGFVAQSQTFSRDGADHWTLTLANPPQAGPTQLDLLFLVDATGSMGDEIDKLKRSMADIADELARLPEMPAVRYGLVAYRDRGDAFVVRETDFTRAPDQFQRTLASLRADGGGDEPESLNAALHTAIHDMSWADEAVRMIVLVADAPPHLDYRESSSYDEDMFAAVARGIKIFPVGASGLNEDGEFIFRQLAQVTGGKFVFLTYEEGRDPSSGPGTETTHDVENYSVDTLDRLIVRLVREELAKLAAVGDRGYPQNQPPTRQQQAPATPPVVSCILRPTEPAGSDRDSCAGLGGAVVQHAPDLLQITLDPATTGYSQVRFDITYDRQPIGYTVNIGDSVSNNGDSGDYGDQSNDAELQVVDSALAVFANDDYRPRAGRMLWGPVNVAQAGATLSLDIADGMAWVRGVERLESPYLFALAGQPDREGPANYDIYAAFNRNITGERLGIGVAEVVVTLYP